MILMYSGGTYGGTLEVHTIEVLVYDMIEVLAYGMIEVLAHGARMTYRRLPMGEYWTASEQRERRQEAYRIEQEYLCRNLCRTCTVYSYSGRKM